MELSTLTATANGGTGPSSKAKAERPRTNTSEAKLVAKKRVIRMLIVIVVLFFLCWMPLYTANTWKAFDLNSAQRALSGAPISFIHLLSYSSACVNPIIYCFMNTRFRKALLATFARCCPRGPAPRCCGRRCGRGRGRGGMGRDGEDDATQTMGASVRSEEHTSELQSR